MEMKYVLSASALVFGFVLATWEIPDHYEPVALVLQEVYGAQKADGTELAVERLVYESHDGERVRESWRLLIPDKNERGFLEVSMPEDAHTRIFYRAFDGAVSEIDRPTGEAVSRLVSDDEFERAKVTLSSARLFLEEPEVLKKFEHKCIFQ